MSESTGIYALWYREFKVFLREKSRIISSVFNPIFLLLILGGGLGSVVSIDGTNYQTFIYPGVLIMAAIFSSIFFGTYIIWDRKIDFLKEVLVAPISRTSIFIGKVLGGATDSLIQILILFLVGFVFSQIGLLSGIHLDVSSALLSFLILFVSISGLVSVGLIIGSQMESPEGFQFIVSFLIFPIFYLSGALFPIDNLPPVLSTLTMLNPVTYSVDGLRGVLLGTSHFHYALDLGVVSVFSLVMIIIGTQAFKRMKV